MDLSLKIKNLNDSGIIVVLVPMYPSPVPQFLGPMSELVVLPVQHFILKKCCSGWLGMWEVTFT